jgi:glutamate racemase
MSKLRNEGPIGVFDCGLAGLTVLKVLAARLPREDFVYFGDTARVPYGTRTAQTVLNYSHACARVLREQRIKLLVVSCHTVSAIALDGLAGELFLPAVGAIAPAARAALQISPRKRIGVLASALTLQSGAYLRSAKALEPEAQVFVQAAPLLAAFAEEGWLDHASTRLAVRECLAPLVAQDIDALVLGGAHCVALAQTITSELAALSGKPLPVIDSALAAAAELAELLTARQLETAREDPGKLRIIVTDMPSDFSVANGLLGQDLGKLQVSAVDV